MEASWKEYSLDKENISYWLKWGGLIHSQILLNKDYSMLSVIQYEAYTHTEEDQSIFSKLPQLTNGWVYWVDDHYLSNTAKHYLCIYWNPFYSRGDTITNFANKQNIYFENAKDGFLSVVVDVFNAMFKRTSCQILQHEALLNYLESSITLKAPIIQMPDTPLYLDALLTQDAGITFVKNDIYIGNDRLAIISLSIYDEADKKRLNSILRKKNISYRHVQRLLLFSEEAAEKEKKRYMHLWCGGRMSIRNMIAENLTSKLNSYYMDVLIISAYEVEFSDRLSYIENQLNSMEISYIVEDYGCKEIWWASLPGMHEPYIQPPIIGFENLGCLLAHQEDAHV